MVSYLFVIPKKNKAMFFLNKTLVFYPKKILKTLLGNVGRVQKSANVTRNLTSTSPKNDNSYFAALNSICVLKYSIVEFETFHYSSLAQN